LGEFGADLKSRNLKSRITFSGLTHETAVTACRSEAPVGRPRAFRRSARFSAE
jgi:hypothetical protein